MKMKSQSPPRSSRLLWFSLLGSALVAAVLAAAAWHVRGGGRADSARAEASGGPPASPTTSTAPSPPPLQVTAITPASGATGVAGTAPIQVSFSSPLADQTSQPSVLPSVPGSWVKTAPSTLTFTPSGAFAPFSDVTVEVPADLRGADGASMAAPIVDHFQVAGGSVLSLQEDLAQLDYLPLNWTPLGPAPDPTDAAGQARAAYTPPAGAFAWRQIGWPTSLTSLWQPGSQNLITKGAVMAFESDHGLPVDGGIAGGRVWAALLQSLATHQSNTAGYNYAVGSKASPERLTIWHDGDQVVQSPANTGIAQAGTADGTFPVYSRQRSQTMQGTNPDGSHYADPVQYVAYFNGGDAVHYIPRASYGDPQSLGCIELPLDQAAAAWPYLTYGTLVTVTG